MNSTTTQRPTPEVNASDTIPYMDDDSLTWWVRKDFARKLERERDEAREQLEAMREAVKEAHYALAYVYNHGEGSCTFPYRTDDDLCSENRFHHVKDALDALQPFVP